MYTHLQKQKSLSHRWIIIKTIVACFSCNQLYIFFHLLFCMHNTFDIQKEYQLNAIVHHGLK